MAASVSLLPPGDVPVSALSRAQLINVLTDTVGDLERLELMLDADGVADARRLRTSLVGQVRDHVLPRLADAELPAVVVVGGSTGAGKSTLVNSVLGAEVSDAGVLRPTTRTPVLVVNPEDIKAFTEHPLAQVCLTVVSDAVPSGLALVDASDLDSVHEANRTLAVRLLEAADLWLFITTAARYGDHTPWSTLEDAAGRRTPIGVVLNRVPARILPEVRRDLVERLEGLGLAESPSSSSPTSVLMRVCCQRAPSPRCATGCGCWPAAIAPPAWCAAPGAAHGRAYAPTWSDWPMTSTLRTTRRGGSSPPPRLS